MRSWSRSSRRTATSSTRSSVAEDDLGRVIGKGGRVANAIRTIAKAAAVRIDRRVIVDILD